MVDISEAINYGGLLLVMLYISLMFQYFIMSACDFCNKKKRKEKKGFLTRLAPLQMSGVGVGGVVGSGAAAGTWVQGPAISQLCHLEQTTAFLSLFL